MAERHDQSDPLDGLSPLAPGDPSELGSYRLLGRLGHGGMGIVYLARSATGRAAAVKVLRPELLSESGAQARFHREIAVVSRVPDDFTAPFLDAEIDEHGVWMATAFIPGLSLQQSVSAFGPLPPGSLYALWYGLLRALHSIHTAGVVHRDLKPSNVLLTTQGPRLIDFGISALNGSTSLTSTGAILGTPGYMGPEQVAGRPDVGPETDIFALGAVMGFAAAGTPPFDGDNVISVIFDVLHGTPRLSALPADLDTWVRACLSKEPAHRPTVDSLLRTLSDTQAVTARRQLAGGDWLPETVSRATLRRAQLVLDLDHPYTPPPAQTPALALPPDRFTTWTVRRPAPGGPTVRLRPPATPTGAVAPPPPTDGRTTDIRVRRDPSPSPAELHATPADMPQAAPREVHTPAPPGPPPDVRPDAVPDAPGRGLLPRLLPVPLPPPPTEPSGGADPAPDALLRTFAVPMEAELPPPPRTGLRRRWIPRLSLRRARR
ncbi:serine/threonine protein kinase [Kitasatospora hibisci]|uniref:serine/threonine protein kinase n=1 Tax=Kitasatospora hibisci TaxID=3369522 RepID=UPI0037547C5A